MQSILEDNLGATICSAELNTSNTVLRIIDKDHGSHKYNIYDFDLIANDISRVDRVTLFGAYKEDTLEHVLMEKYPFLLEHPTQNIIIKKKQSLFKRALRKMFRLD